MIKITFLCVYMCASIPPVPVQCRIQSQGSAGIPVRYRSGWHCFSDTLRKEGVSSMMNIILVHKFTVKNALTYHDSGSTIFIMIIQAS